MFSDAPHFWPVAAWTILGAILVGGAYYSREMSGFLAFVLTVAGVVCWCGAAVNGVYYLIGGYIEARRQIANIALRTPMIELARLVKGMTDNQILLVQSGRTIRDIIPGPQGPLTSMILDDTKIPEAFIAEYMEQSDATYLKPTSDYNDSARRGWANAIVHYLVKRGYANKEIGNVPPTWNPGGRVNALVLFGFTEEG